ncbi:MAG: acetyl-CoA carboxylase biotin carboxyl carrier protein subunit [Muribaculaceae bacterium]|nr:acetyl-CoA carboxylase biotin carboxyl carrier protein subunit [Muribaculaceae bacterium]
MKEYKYKINGNSYNVTVGDIEDNLVTVEVNGTPYHVELDKAKPVKVVAKAKPASAPRTATGEKVVAKPAPAAPSAGTTVKAPLPGVVLSINFKVGDAVKASDTVLSLEAMKMENAIHAGKDGVVSAILVNLSDSVLEGTPLFTIQ